MNGLYFKQIQYDMYTLFAISDQIPQDEQIDSVYTDAAYPFS